MARIRNARIRLKTSLNQLALYFIGMPKDHFHFSAIRRRADNFTLSYMTRLDSRLLKRVEKLYEVDFEMFGYSPYLGWIKKKTSRKNALNRLTADWTIGYLQKILQLSPTMRINNRITVKLKSNLRFYKILSLIWHPIPTAFVVAFKLDEPWA